jgi:hypothetical protein
MWVVMMVAMILPSLVPMLWRYHQAVSRTGETHLGALTALVGVGYFFVWTVFGVAAFPLGVTLAEIEMQQPARAVPIGHRAQAHDPDDQEDRHQTTDTAAAAVEPEAQAVLPGRAGVGRQRTAAPGRLPAAGKAMRLPRAELEGAGDEDFTGNDRKASLDETSTNQNRWLYW